jgi:hypothetical protein
VYSEKTERGPSPFNLKRDDCKTKRCKALNKDGHYSKYTPSKYKEKEAVENQYQRLRKLLYDYINIRSN